MFSTIKLILAKRNLGKKVKAFGKEVEAFEAKADKYLSEAQESIAKFDELQAKRKAGWAIKRDKALTDLANEMLKENLDRRAVIDLERKVTFYSDAAK